MLSLLESLFSFTFFFFLTDLEINIVVKEQELLVFIGS